MNIFRNALITAMVILVGGCGESETESVDASEQDIRIYRDSSGVPHIYGATATEVMFGAGYAMAEDRLLEIFYRCRLGKGRLAEMLGPDHVGTDKYIRTRSYTEREWREMLDDLPPNHRRFLQANLDGINAYIKEALENPTEKLPYEFTALGIKLEPLTLTDLAAGAAYTAKYFGGGGGYEIQNLEMWNDLVVQHGEDDAKIIFNDILVLDDPDAFTSVPPESDAKLVANVLPKNELPQLALQSSGSKLKGVSNSQNARQAIAQVFGAGASRAIVVGPERSETGNVLMLQATADGIDMHLSGGGFDVAGLTMPPIAVPVMGRTSNFGWLITTGENDMADIYAETVNPENPDQYMYEGVWHDLERRQELIQVAGAEPVSFEVLRTVHGPVIDSAEDGKTLYSLKTLAWKQELSGVARGFDRALADNLAEFEAAVYAEAHLSYNVLYGDRDGHIEYWHTGAVPVRPGELDPRLPVPGTGEFEWQSLRATEDWPNVANPAQQYLHSWNSKPSATTRYGDMSRWGGHFRSYLPKALVEADDSITIADLARFNRIIADHYASIDLTVTSPAYFAPDLAEAVAQSQDEQLIRAQQIIADWDGAYVDKDENGFYDHVGLTIFRKWVPTALDLLFSDDIGEWWHRFDEEMYIKYRTSLLLRALAGGAAGQPMLWDFFNGESREDFLRRSLQITVNELTAEYETADMSKWYQARFFRKFSRDPMLGLAIELGHIPPAIPHNGMPSWTTIMELGQKPASLDSLTPSGGQSRFINQAGEASPHIADQIQRHLHFDMKTVWLDEDDVRRNAKLVATLSYGDATP
ncbi:MAG: penicillin acylase family protein [Pseudomonadota bacterium]